VEGKRTWSHTNLTGALQGEKKKGGRRPIREGGAKKRERDRIRKWSNRRGGVLSTMTTSWMVDLQGRILWMLQRIVVGGGFTPSSKGRREGEARGVVSSFN